MDFRFHENVAAKDSQSGHIVHSLRLHVKSEAQGGDQRLFYGDEVGYINVTYIPSETWRELYTGDWGMVRWLSDFTGACGLTETKISKDKNGDSEIAKEWLHKDLRKTVVNLSKYLDPRGDRVTKEMGGGALEEAFHYYTDEIRNRHGEDYKASKMFHVDKPRVEFIRVAKHCRRKGYGTALYKRMTKELAERYGFDLYDGGLQSTEAEATWEHLIYLPWNDAKETQYPGDDRGRTRYKLSWRKKNEDRKEPETFPVK